MAGAVPQSADALRDWLRSLKEASGASFADIARAIGEEERTVKRWMPEKGKAVVPSGDSLLRLLDYFGVELTPPAPRAVALSIAGELRELREIITRAASPFPYDPELGHLTEEERALLDGWVAATAGEASFAEIAAHLGISVEEGHARYEAVLLKTHLHPPNQARLLELAPLMRAVLQEEGVVVAGGEGEILRRLESLEGRVAELPTADDLKRGLESIRRSIARANRDSGEGPSTARKSSSR